MPGKFFILSFPEAIPNDDTLYFIQDKAIGGVVLFAAHCRDQASLKSWLRDLKRSLDYNLIVAVDQEGGRVRRFTTGFPSLEAPRYYGHHGKLDQYRNDLARVCERLFEIGVNLNLVPTVDLFDTDKDHVLDSRTFGNDADLVNRFARATIDIHHSQGLICCAKHFPGLGRSSGDPHRVLSESDLGEDDFFNRELGPFREAIDYGVDAVMVTHLLAKKVDEKPAIISDKIIGGWLKDRLGFCGPVITDDLNMEGAVQAASTRAAVESFTAGADLLLYGQNLKKAREAIDIFDEFFQNSGLSPERIKDAASRVDSLRQKIESV